MASRSADVMIARSGPGALCPEAQADGVPCSCLGVDCEACASADPARLPPPRPAPLASEPGGRSGVADA
jgi:hypothetical protein